MSRKDITEAAENVGLSADIGPVLKLMGDVFTKQWQSEHGVHLSAEERKEHGKKPIAEVQQSDIQIRVGNQLFTVQPTDESKAMVSIPVGLSDKATPATIPREWLIGMFIDAMIVMCEGDATIAIKYTQGINAAINRAMQVSEEGKMKIDQSSLPEPHHAIEVAEMIESFRRTFRSKSAGTPKLHFTFDVQTLEQVEEPIVEEVVEASISPAELLSQHADALLSGDEEPELVIGGGTTSTAELVADEIKIHIESDLEYAERVAKDDGGFMLADPTPPVDEIKIHIESDLEYAERIAKENEIVEDELERLSNVNPYNFKKETVAWIKHELNAEYHRSAITINDVADHAGCHVQTIKRALDKFEAEADYTHCHTDEWTELGFELDDTTFEGVVTSKRLLITCERSPTGRYARGRPIHFIIRPQEELPFTGPTVDEEESQEIPIEATTNLSDEELVAQGITVELTPDGVVARKEIPIDIEAVLKVVDETDPSLHACPDCFAEISKEQSVEDAPDWICGDCHWVRMTEDEEWAEQTNERSARRAIYEAKPKQEIPIEALIDREAVVAEFEAIIEDAEPYELPDDDRFVPSPDIVIPITESIQVIEGVKDPTGRVHLCIHCPVKASMEILTAIGVRNFCSEKCWAEYTGEPVMPEGHYGMQAEYDEELKLQRETTEDEYQPYPSSADYDLGNAMGF
jgi:hypothetical protein